MVRKLKRQKKKEEKMQDKTALFGKETWERKW